MRMIWLAAICICTLLTAQNLTHPQDALTAAELNQAVDLMWAEGLMDESSRVSTLSLREPEKAVVLAWQEGQPIPRAAFTIVRSAGIVYEGIIDLTHNRIADWKEVERVQSSILFEEIINATALVLGDQDFRNALALRNLENIDNISCGPLTVGYFGAEEEREQRLMKINCFDLNGTLNTFGRPIGGLYAVVDLDSSEVLRVIDKGLQPVPSGNAQYNLNTVEGPLQEPLNPTVSVQWPRRNFTVDGHVVTWNNWKFHYRMDKRQGLVISQVAFKDGEQYRSVMYQGALSEVYVPYMDPTEEWYYKLFIDAGEYGMGLLSFPMSRGVDMPSYAYTDSIVFPDDVGRPTETPDVVAIFERNLYDPVWRHTEFLHPSGLYFEGRHGIELVVRTIATVGNYDYTVDWIFSLDGIIKVRTTANGIDNGAGVGTEHMSDPSAPTDTAFGTLLAPNVVAVNHSHFFNYRLDLDVDGQNNNYVKTRFTAKAPKVGPRQSIWVTEDQVQTDEQSAKTRYMPQSPAVWRFTNPGVQNHVGYPVSYKLMTGNSAMASLILPDSYELMRGEFVDYNLWVTPYAYDEQFAAGVYVNQKTEHRGLAKWTQANRAIENTDIVAWYTVGFHHIPRSEDWPVAPRMPRTFMLVPHNFFDRNPSITLPGFRRDIPNFKRKQN